MLRNSSDVPKRRGRPPAGGREAILAAALQLLRERGIARVTSREVANMIAPPMPWNARERARNVASGAIPHRAEPIVKTTIPMANISLRPLRSAIDPEVSRNAARVSA